MLGRLASGCSSVRSFDDARWADRFLVLQSRIAYVGGGTDVGALADHTGDIAQHRSFVTSGFFCFVLSKGRFGRPRDFLMQSKQTCLGVVRAVHDRITSKYLFVGSGSTIGEISNQALAVKVIFFELRFLYLAL